MQDSFTCFFTSKVCCANRIFRSVSRIYCSFHLASSSCRSVERSLQSSLWLPKLSSILQKLAKCSTSFHGPMGVVPIDFFYSVSAIYCSFHSASHSCGSDEGSFQPSLWLPKLSSILKKLPRCSTSLHGHFECGANSIFNSVSPIYCSFQSASHSCGSNEGSLQP